MKSPQLESISAGSLKLEKTPTPYYEPQNLFLAGARLLMKGLTALSKDWAARTALSMFSTPHGKPWNGEAPPIFLSGGQYLLSNGQGRLKVYSWGESGPRVLLVHGWESRAFTFAKVIPDLLEQGFRVVAIDGPAHGESSGRTTNLVEFGEAIQSVLDHYELDGGINHIIAHSFGAAAVAYQLSQQTTTTSVESIALVSMPTKMNQIVQSFGNVVALTERVLEKMINLIYDKVGVRINQLDLGSRFGYIRADRILTVHDEFDPVVGLNHLDSIDPLLKNHSFHLTKGLGHNRILKDSQTMEFVNKFLKKEGFSHRGTQSEAIMKLDKFG